MYIVIAHLCFAATHCRDEQNTLSKIDNLHQAIIMHEQWTDSMFYDACWAFLILWISFCISSRFFFPRRCVPNCIIIISVCTRKATWCITHVCHLLSENPGIPYCEKLSWEKTFANFVDMCSFAKVFFANIACARNPYLVYCMNPRKFFSRNLNARRFRESFLPRKFTAIQILSIVILPEVQRARVL